MRRLLIAIGVVALSFAGFVPAAQANHHSPTPAAGTGACSGTTQWYDATFKDGTEGTVWQFINDDSQTPIFGNHCAGANGWFLPEFIPALAFPYLHSIKLSGTGDLECGNGTLQGSSPVPAHGPVHFESFFGTDTVHYDLEWTAEFENGIGTLTGTGVDRFRIPSDPKYHPPIDVSGTIVLQSTVDGSCNDTPDSPPTNAVVHLEWQPQS